MNNLQQFHPPSTQIKLKQNIKQTENNRETILFKYPNDQIQKQIQENTPLLQNYNDIIDSSLNCDKEMQNLCDRITKLQELFKKSPQNEIITNYQKQQLQQLNTKHQNILKQQQDSLLQLIHEQKKLHEIISQFCQEIQLNEQDIDKTSMFLQQYIKNLSKNKLYISEDNSDICKHYNIQILKLKNQIKEYCNRRIEVKQIGNSFYLCVSYQYLIRLFNKNDKKDFDTFIKKIQALKLLQIDQNIPQNELKNFLIWKLNNIWMLEIKDRINLFNYQFSQVERDQEYNCYLAPLLVLFFKYFLINQAELNEDEIKKVLKWDEEYFSDNIIQKMAQFLNTEIVTFTFNDNNCKLECYGYLKNNQDKIVLLINKQMVNIGFKD